MDLQHRFHPTTTICPGENRALMVASRQILKHEIGICFMYIVFLLRNTNCWLCWYSQLHMGGGLAAVGIGGWSGRGRRRRLGRRRRAGGGGGGGWRERGRGIVKTSDERHWSQCHYLRVSFTHVTYNMSDLKCWTSISAKVTVSASWMLHKPSLTK